MHEVSISVKLIDLNPIISIIKYERSYNFAYISFQKLVVIFAYISFQRVLGTSITYTHQP